MTTWLDNYKGMSKRVTKWNKAQATKHLRQTLALAAKTTKEHPSSKFVAIINPNSNYQGYGSRKVDPNKLLVELQKLGVTPDQLITP